MPAMAELLINRALAQMMIFFIRPPDVPPSFGGTRGRSPHRSHWISAVTAVERRRCGIYPGRFRNGALRSGRRR
jgi:hypothetical protein